MTDSKTLRKINDTELTAVGIAINPERDGLTCMACGVVWAIQILSVGGRRPKGWWLCPQGCNGPTTQDREEATRRRRFVAKRGHATRVERQLRELTEWMSIHMPDVPLRVPSL